MPKFEFTPELIKQQTDLKDLPDNQVSAILTLSNNMLTEAMKEKSKEYYDSTDAIFKEHGIERGTTEHTNDLLRRVAKSAKEYGTEKSALEAKIADLEKSIKEGNTDKATKDKLAELEQKLADSTKKSKDWEGKYNSDLTAKEQALQSEILKNNKILVDVEFQKALAGVTFKSVELLPEADRNFLIEAKKNQLLSQFTPDFIDDGKGGKILVFRNADKSIVNNPEKGMNPMTAGDLLLKEITFAIDAGRNAGGGGTKPPAQNSNNSTQFALNGAKTKMEAESAIREWQIANGRDMKLQETHDEALKIFTEAKAGSLPLR